MVYYLKYRPQKISDLDSAYIREKLTNVLSGKSIVHALLFTGPKGLGKTSTARIVAKAVNCETRNVILSTFDKLSVNSAKDLKKKRDSSAKPQNDKGNSIEPCNKCSSCISITNGSNIDVLEIDGASNRGIDEIRDLREKVRLAPASAKKKVYIIDEVHMLTTEAFNALLKTLEEPPSHVMFIFCTTEPHKVPETISSRCFQIEFKRASDEELVSSFTRIIEGEKLKADEDALFAIASLSDGSFRDGAKILEEVVFSSDGKKITKELIDEKFQISNIQFQISNLIKSLEKKDAKQAILIVSELVDKGVDIKYFIAQLIDFLHSLLLTELGVVQEREFKIQSIRQAQDKNSKFKIEDIKSLIELLTKAHSEIRYAVLPQLPLELAIVEWSTNSEHSENSDKADNQINQTVRQSDTPIHRKSGLPSNSEYSDLWKKLIDSVKTRNHSLAGVLRGCSLDEFKDNSLTIITPFKFHKEKLEDKKAMEILEKVVGEITGNKVTVLIQLKDK